MDVMAWIAGWIPLLCFVIGFVIKWWLNRAWVATIVVFGGTYALLEFHFGMSFWAWLWLYVFLCWFGSWAASFLRSLQKEKQKTLDIN